jgi:site-specific recombinase XerD
MIYSRGGKGHENTARNSKVKFKRGGVKGKIEDYKFLTEEQVHEFLKVIEKDKNNANRFRDHCIVLCGFYFGLRIGEVHFLKRENFKWLDRNYADIPTLKQRKKPEDKGKPWPPTVRIPGVETFVVEYLKNYMKTQMSDEQEYLFVTSSIHKPISNNMVDRIFNTYAAKIKLSNVYSWHALRHGRGVHIWERFKDLLKVARMLRHKSLKSTEIYVHMSPSGREEFLSQLNESKNEKIKPLSRD